MRYDINQGPETPQHPQRGARGGRRFRREPRGFGGDMPDDVGDGPRAEGFAGRGGGRGRGGGHGGGRGGHRGRGRGRGDVRAAVLLLLDEQARHGYELIQEITERSEGSWAPSPGSVYPTLQVLEDEGLVVIEPVDGRRVASLTEAGTTYVEENRTTLGTPWSTTGAGHLPALALRQDVLALKDAVAQVARVGTPTQLAAASEVLQGARKSLYRILAEDDAEPRTE